MRTEFLTRVVAFGVLSVVLGTHGRVFAQAVHEPTIDERFRDENVKPAKAEVPQLNPPQNPQARLKQDKPTTAKGSPGAYLGVTFSNKVPEAIVRTVAPGSPAEQAGLQPNDLIETLQGRRIRTSDDVPNIVAKMQPGDILNIGVTRRMNIRTQAPLAALPSATPHSVGYSPASPASDEAAPEDPLDTRQRTPQNRNQSSTGQRRNDNSKNNQSDENRRLFGRGLRLR
jgi:membrane-associated protease RseP (regulator of RpoE activity)